jgi:hypothetical protein
MARKGRQEALSSLRVTVEVAEWTTFDRLESLREEHITPRGSMQPFTWVAGRLRSR